MVGRTPKLGDHRRVTFYCIDKNPLHNHDGRNTSRRSDEEILGFLIRVEDNAVALKDKSLFASRDASWCPPEHTSTRRLNLLLACISIQAAWL